MTENSFWHLKFPQRSNKRIFTVVLCHLPSFCQYLFHRKICVRGKTRKFNFKTFLQLRLMNFHLHLIRFFSFTGSSICALLVANPNHLSFKVPQTLRDDETYGVNSNNQSCFGLLKLVSQSFFVRFSVGEFSKSFQESDVVWNAFFAIHLSSTRYKVNTHRNTSRKRRSECWYPVKIASNWNFQNARWKQISARSVHFLATRTDFLWNFFSCN